MPRQPRANRSSLALDSLHRLVLTAPHELERRRVLADALLERGDSRGEFIALQLRRGDTPRSKPGRRERALQQRHAKKWLGPLARYLRKWRFEAGFVASAELAAEVPPKHRKLAEWATLTSLVVRGASSRDLLRSGALISLREVHGLDLEDFVELLRGGSLGWRSVSIQCQPRDDLDSLVVLGRTFALRSLELTWTDSRHGSTFPCFADLKRLLSSPLISSLEKLSLAVNTGRDANQLIAWAARSQLEALRIAVDSSKVVAKVDMKARRVEAPADLAGELEVPRGFSLLAGPRSSRARGIDAAELKLELLEALRAAEEWELEWRVRFGQKLTGAQQAVLEKFREAVVSARRR